MFAFLRSIFRRHDSPSPYTHASALVRIELLHPSFKLLSAALSLEVTESQRWRQRAERAEAINRQRARGIQ